MCNKNNRLVFVGGEDVRMRIPMLLALRDRGYDVFAIGSEDEGEFLKHSIPYYKYSLYRWVGPLTDFRTIGELTKLLLEIQPDIVHGFDTKPSIYVPISGKRANVPYKIRTITGMGYVFSSNNIIALLLRPVYRFLHRLAARSADITIFQNNDDKSYFETNKMLGRSESHLVRSSGIDIQMFLEKIDSENIEIIRNELNLKGKIVITMVARLVKDKGVIEFLKAAKKLKLKYNDVEFLLVGPVATEGSQAVSKDEILSYSDYVTFLGPRQDVPDILSASSVFVLPSYYREGVPRILLEAGVAGLPLITTNMPGCKEVVEINKNGCLVEPKNIESLVHAMEYLIKMPNAQRCEMGKNSKKIVVDNFSLEKVLGAYDRIYRSMSDKVRVNG